MAAGLPARQRLSLVLDIGFRTVAAGGGLGVPFAVGGLVFDRLGAARHALLGGNPLGGGKRGGMGRERLRKHPIDGIGPAAVMLNDLVGDMGHAGTRFLLALCDDRGEAARYSMTKSAAMQDFTLPRSSSIQGDNH